MKRILCIAILAGVILVGVWTLMHRDQIQGPSDFWRLASQQLAAWQAAWSAAPEAGESPGDPHVLRVATFCIRTIPASTPSQQTIQRVADVCRQFDVVALQVVGPTSPPWLGELVQFLNRGPGAHYTLTIGEPNENLGQIEQPAFLFNQSRVQLDQAVTYAVDDPDQLMARAPYVGWFRAVGPPPDQAFTFSLVNVHLTPRQTTRELAYLRELFRAVRRDGRQEDDVLVAGNFNADPTGFEHLRRFGIHWLVTQGATTTRSSALTDNILFEPRSTTEYRGAGGVFNFVKHFNLTLDESLAISEHLPVWGEFSVYEGFEPGRSARRDSADRATH